MADEYSTYILKETEKIVNEFKEDLIRLLSGQRGLKMDSRTIQSLQIVINESKNYVALEGIYYIYFVIHGRAAGKMPPPDPVTGKWPLPYPAAKQIADHGNLQKFKPVADAFDKLFIDTVKKANEVLSSKTVDFIMTKFKK